MLVALLDKINSPRLRRRKMSMDSDSWPWKYHAQYFTILNIAIERDLLIRCDSLDLMKKILHFFRNVRQCRTKQGKTRMRRGEGFGGSNNSLNRMMNDSSIPIVEILSVDSTDSSGQDQMLQVSTKEDESNDDSNWGPHVGFHIYVSYSPSPRTE